MLHPIGGEMLDMPMELYQEISCFSALMSAEVQNAMAHKQSYSCATQPDKVLPYPCLQCSSKTHMACSTYTSILASTSTMIQVFPTTADSCSNKNEHPADVQHSGWQCLLLRNLH